MTHTYDDVTHTYDDVTHTYDDVTTDTVWLPGATPAANRRLRGR